MRSLQPIHNLSKTDMLPSSSGKHRAMFDNSLSERAYKAFLPFNIFHKAEIAFSMPSHKRRDTV